MASRISIYKMVKWVRGMSLVMFTILQDIKFEIDGLHSTCLFDLDGVIAEDLGAYHTASL